MNDNKTIELNEYELIKIIRYYYLTYEHKKIYGKYIRTYGKNYKCDELIVEAFYKEKNIIHGINVKKKVAITLNFEDIKEIISKVFYSNYKINVSDIDIATVNNPAYQYLTDYKCLKIKLNEIEQEKNIDREEENKKTENIFKKIKNKVRKRTLSLNSEKEEI